MIYDLGWIEGFAIFCAVFVVSGVGSYNDYKKDEQFVELQKINAKDNKVIVKRNGLDIEINYDDIYVGDLIKIEGGKNIPVDGIVVRSMGLSNDESAMTGESDEVLKNSLDLCKLKQEEKDAEFIGQKDPQKQPHDLPSPMMLSGTSISIGEGWYMALVVGKRSQIGKIMEALEEEV